MFNCTGVGGQDEQDLQDAKSVEVSHTADTRGGRGATRPTLDSAKMRLVIPKSRVRENQRRIASEGEESWFGMNLSGIPVRY